MKKNGWNNSSMFLAFWYQCFQGIYLANLRIIIFSLSKIKLSILVSGKHFPILFFIPIRSENRAFTLFWLFLVSLLVGLVFIQNINLS